MGMCGRLLAMLAVLAVGLPASAQTPAQPSPAAAPGPAYVVTFFESGPPSAAKTAAALRRLAAASLKEQGVVAYLVLRERGRPGRFAVLETWRDKAALDAHDNAAKALDDKLRALLISPPDRRACVGLDIAAPVSAAPNNSTILVLTHVDVVPTAKDEAIGLVKELAADSRKDTGVARFDVLQQGNRANHMFLVEAWRDRTAHDNHVMAEHTIAFRTKLLPKQGALYDERLYEAIR